MTDDSETKDDDAPHGTVEREDATKTQSSTLGILGAAMAMAGSYGGFDTSEDDRPRRRPNGPCRSCKRPNVARGRLEGVYLCEKCLDAATHIKKCGLKFETSMSPPFADVGGTWTRVKHYPDGRSIEVVVEYSLDSVIVATATLRAYGGGELGVVEEVGHIPEQFEIYDCVVKMERGEQDE